MKNQILYKIIGVLFLVVLFFGCENPKHENKDGISKESIYGKLNPNAPKETLQFGQLVGKWNVVSMDSIPNKGWHQSKATWTFKYSLEGYAVEDIWYEKIRDSTNNTINIGRDYIGKNIRIFDPTAQTWSIAWIENGQNTMNAVYTAKAKSNGDIVMITPNRTAEITFSNITPTSFNWTYEIVTDNKRILYSKMSAKKIKSQ